MPATIRSAAEMAGALDEATNALRGRMLEAGRNTGWEIAQIVRSTTKFNDVTGNLRASIGVRKSLRPADYSLGLQAKREDQASLMRGKPLTIRVHMRVGMAYAYFVAAGYRQKSRKGKAVGGYKGKLGSAGGGHMPGGTRGIGFTDEGFTKGPQIAAREFAGMIKKFEADTTIRIGSRGRGARRTTYRRGRRLKQGFTTRGLI